ncbi:RHS repeat-associated core domain-containing protein, partial [Pseudomonas helleri]
MSAKKTVLLHQYAYDPLDRHVKSGGSQGDETQVFYNNDRVATEIKGNTAYRVFETDNAVLGQLTTTPRGVETALIAHDDKRSTLATLTSEQHTPVAYTAAGYSTADEQRVLGFNGERDDKTTGHYLLGNGYRAFNPVLMRFNSPDSWSPFGDGGINAYAYCAGDPVNRTDPTGHFWRSLFKGIGNIFGRTPSKTFSTNQYFKVVARKNNAKIITNVKPGKSERFYVNYGEREIAKLGNKAQPKLNIEEMVDFAESAKNIIKKNLDYRTQVLNYRTEHQFAIYSRQGDPTKLNATSDKFITRTGRSLESSIKDIQSEASHEKYINRAVRETETLLKD